MTYILHISDLHFVNNAASHNSGEVLIREAAEKTRAIPRGQKLLIVTGDFHNFSDPDYRNAEDFLRRLAEGMDLDLTRDVFVVPGNHDVGNDGLLKPLLEPNDPKWRAHRKAALQMLKDGDREYLDERLQVFLPYCAMVQRLGIYDEALGRDYPARTHVRCWRGRLNVLHLNTALTADGKTKTDQTTDTAGAADPKTWEGLYREELPAIAIGHNSFYDLEKTQRRDLAGSFALRNVSAYLCGDTHLTETDPERQMIRLESGCVQRPEIPNLTAARGIADGDDSYSDVGFCWQLWDEERDLVTVEFRKWTREQLAQTQPNGQAGAYPMLHAARPAADGGDRSAAGPADPGPGPEAPEPSELPLLPPFKIAFTFTGEYRERIVRPVCRELLKLGFTREDLFFDDWHSELFTGVNADSVFKTIYHDASDCVVVLLSPNYREKLWTDHLEWPTVRALINEGRHRKICLLNVDHVDIATIDGLKPGRDVAKELDGMSPREIAEFIWKWYCRHILRRNPEKSALPQPEPPQLEKAQTEAAHSEPEEAPSQQPEEPGLLRFGRYPQTKDGEERPIEWRVLAREEDRCLLVSRYALDCMPFRKDGLRGAWEDSELRDWLNRDFLRAAFTEAERAGIQPVTVSKERTYPAKGGKGDKLFLLSVTEAADGRLFSGDADRACAFTAYAAARRSRLARLYQPEDLSCWWWLRSLGDRPDRAAFVSYLGTVDTGGRAVDRRELGLRPAFWLRTKPEPLPKEEKAEEKAPTVNPMLEQKRITGVNRDLFVWAEDSPLYLRALGGADPEQKLLAAALGPNENDRGVATAALMKAIWEGHPELGLAPDYRLLTEKEHNRDYYPKYRDHSTHMFKVFLLGLYLYERHSALHKAVDAFFREAPKPEEAFLSVWTLTALYHDMGYLIETEDGTRDSNEAQFVYARLSDTLALPLTHLFPKRFGTGTEAGLQKQYRSSRRLIPAAVETLTDLEQKLALLKGLGLSVRLCADPEGNPLQAYYNYLPRRRGSRSYYDHGVVSACMLLFVRDALCQYLEECPLEALYPEQAEALRGFLAQEPEYRRFAELAARAIALHNVKKDFNETEALELNQAGVTIGEFRIPLAQEPIAYLLRLCDELQCWDRRRYDAPERFTLSGDKLCFNADAGRLSLSVFDSAVRGKLQAALEGLLEPPVKECVELV